MDDFADLRRAVEQAEDALAAAKAALVRAQSEKAGVAVGDLVRGTAGKHAGLEGIVAEVLFWSSPPFVYVRRRLRAGGFAVNRTYLGGDWEVISRAYAEPSP